MMKYDELLADLRGWTRICVSYEGSIDEILDKAADAIEELQKENLRLHAFNDMNLEAREMLHDRIKELIGTNGYGDGYEAGYQKGLEECKRIGRLDDEGMLHISEEEYNTMSKAMLIVMYLKDVQNMLGEFEV